jgi:hypothetical protein
VDLLLIATGKESVNDETKTAFMLNLAGNEASEETPLGSQPRNQRNMPKCRKPLKHTAIQGKLAVREIPILEHDPGALRTGD